ncbi:TetR/AcrR family transcriptional regulator [Actinophytocola gossypii]|uniref:TetR/AcrR family transcriptional regulator n=1 Tax=Actinophytocola gossypii TaxID=2812003 RepID=A0ABT2J878_9PSEU|nr:TetR/AcrR family transcriptional regulator [Actinophytocola gossypii]MCT2584063.1 TetR/AcrR family transcriptional regulator [Actinophytocola gossypii]
MGNREDLLAAAKHCLLEKGYDRTTVRDIASAAKVSMAAIGYHYGSREALLNEALFEAMDDWGDRVGRALAPDSGDEGSSAERFAARIARMTESLGENRQFWLASFEAFMQAQRSPELREQLATGQADGRRGLAAMVLGVPEDEVPDDAARTVGAVQLALISGIAVQWLSDPDTAPTGADVLAGLRALLGVRAD